MEQRPLRLGDIVDDYCPRERRITNHAIVAVVGSDIKQTRCTTCDSEHVYKEAKVPKRRKAAPTAFDQVLANVGGSLVPPRASDEPESPPASASAAEPEDAAPDGPEAAPAARSLAASDADAEMPESNGTGDEPPDAADAPRDEGWPLHRRLIRATLPRTEGEPPPQRPIPEFTMHQWQARGGRGGRGGGWHGNGNHGGSHGHHGSQGNHGNVDGNRQPGARGARPPADGNSGNPPGRKSGRRRRRNKRPRH